MPTGGLLRTVWTCGVAWISRDKNSRGGVVIFAIAFLASDAAAAAKPHVISFGKWTLVPWFAGTSASKPPVLKVRALIVDGRVKEYVLGSPHEVTERLFVVRRAFRINDSLPREQGGPRWQWERGEWLFVDRMTGRISPINLPEFDALYSAESWFRDYVAYCGVSDDGKKVYAIVAQISRRKPVMKNPLPAQESATARGPIPPVRSHFGSEPRCGSVLTFPAGPSRRSQFGGM